MQRLLTAMIVLVLAMVLVSPLVDSENAVTGAQQESAEAGQVVEGQVTTLQPVTGGSEANRDFGASSRPFTSLRC